jgi:hypothetical protein
VDDDADAGFAIFLNSEPVARTSAFSQIIPIEPRIIIFNNRAPNLILASR